MADIHAKLRLRLQRLDDNLEGEFGELLERIATGYVPGKVELAALALLLQNVYTEMEHVFKVIAQDFDGDVLVSDSWHRDLLDRMLAPGSRRPALLSPALYQDLNSYRAFRHFARNATVLVLEWDQMQPLVCSCRTMIEAFASTTIAFLDALE